MLTADIPTLFLAAIATSLFLAVSLGVMARGSGMEALKPWAYALFLHTAAYVLFALRGVVPDVMSIVGANTAESLFVAFWVLALARFQGRHLHSSVVFGPVVLTILVFYGFSQDLTMRIVLGNPILIFQELTLLYLLRRLPGKSAGGGRFLLQASMVVTVLLTGFRVLAVALGYEQVFSLTTRSTLQTLLFLTGSVIPLVGSVGFVFMLKERADRLVDDGKRTLTAVVDSAAEGIAMFHRDGTLIQINRAGAERFNATPQKMVGLNMADFMPPEVVAPRLAVIHRVADSGKAEHLVDQRDGHTFRQVYYPVAGESDRVVGYAADITESLAAETALRRSEEHFRAFFERSMVGMATTSPTKGWLEVNQALCDILGYPREELLQQTWIELTHPDDIAADVAEFERVVAGAKDEYAMDKRFIRKDGTVVYAYIASRCVRSADGTIDYFVALVEDISERKAREVELAQRLAEMTALNHKLEDTQGQLLQSEKMASIGQLAAGVAHELNNPIGFVHSNLGTLETYLEDIFEIANACETAAAKAVNPADFARIDALKAEKDFDFLKTDIFQLMHESKDGLSRVKKIVQDLKDFSRVEDVEWQWADLHHCLDSTLNIVWNELKYKCTVNKHYADALPQINCLPSQLNQVFMNLLVNAAQAIPEKGEITISTTHPGVDSVQVRIRDTGSGIAAENLARIFDPFFTTKPVGKGTGLGLSIAYGIIQRHKGRIEARSTVGEGTTFIITLPVDSQEASESATAVPSAPTP
jgi:PAS domain S-box-containing protein